MFIFKKGLFLAIKLTIMNYIFDFTRRKNTARKVMAVFLIVSILLPIGSMFQVSYARAEGEEAVVDAAPASEPEVSESSDVPEVATDEVTVDEPVEPTLDVAVDAVQIDEEVKGEVKGEETRQNNLAGTPDPKVNICHATGSENNPWNAIRINQSALQDHLDNHGDFLYTGPVNPNNDQPINPEGDIWCADNAPTEVTVVASKIVCEEESMLPDWGNIPGGPTITEDTAQDWVNNHKGCELVSGWEFAWSEDGAGNPGDNTLGTGGAGWTSFGSPTDANGQTSVTIDVSDGDRFWFREAPQAGYLPFDGSLNTQDDKVSAEFYCNNDVINYDNWEWIGTENDPIQAGHTYHCVAWNVAEDVPPPPPQECFAPDTLGGEDFTNVWESQEEDLQDVLDNAGYNLNVNHPDSDQWGYQQWNTSNSVTLNTKFIAKYAGNASKFGYYTNGDVNTFTQIYDSATANEGDVFSTTITGATSVAFAIKTTGMDGEIMFSTVNADNWEPSEDHAITFKPSADTYVIAYEDLTQEQGADWDFNDMVVEVSLEECDSCTPEYHSMTIVSDENNNEVFDGDLFIGNAVAAWDEHPAWTASIPGATWIWDSYHVEDPEVDTYRTFIQEFEVVGEPTTATLDIAADNSYKVWVNGSLVAEDANEDNHSSGTQDDVTDGDLLVAVNPGTNTIKVEVKNWAQPGGSWESNPAGALYSLTVRSYDDCTDPEPEGPQVTVHKFIDGVMATDESAEGHWFHILTTIGKGDTQDQSLNADNNFSWQSPAIESSDSVSIEEVTYDGENYSRVLPMGSKCTDLPCPADLDEDGDVDTDDLLIVIGNWTNDSEDRKALKDTALDCATDVVADRASCVAKVEKEVKALKIKDEGGIAGQQNVPGDVDGDGIVNVTDLLTVIASWGKCSNTYVLEGYKVGDSIEDAENNKMQESVNLSEIDSDKIVLVYNMECREVPPPPQSCGIGTERIVNGGFETPAISLGWDIVPSGTVGLHWLVDWVGGTLNYDGDVRPATANMEIHRGVNGWAPASGSQHVELDSDWEGPSGNTSGEPAATRISQDIPTKIGSTYQISYAFSARPGTDLANNSVKVSVEGGQVDLQSQDGTGDTQTDWQTFTKSFVATDTTTTISFEDVGTPEDSQGTFIDDVSVKCIDEDDQPNNPDTPEEICGNQIDDDNDGLIDEDCGTGGDNSSGGGGSSGGRRSTNDGEVLGAEDSLPGLPHTGTGAAQTTLPALYVLGLSLAFVSIVLGYKAVAIKSK